MANERSPQQIIGDDAFNQLVFEGYVITRPAAPVAGLETVGYQYRLRSGDWCRSLSAYPYATMENSRALVDQSQAKAIIAAERSMRKTAEQRLAQSQDDLKQARADNAALTARVKELESERVMIVSHATMGGTDGFGLNVNDISVRVTALRNELYKEGDKRAKVLETQLATARKALDAIAGYCDQGSVKWRQEHPDLSKLIDHPGVVSHGLVINTICQFARAALEPKP